VFVPQYLNTRVVVVTLLGLLQITDVVTTMSVVNVASTYVVVGCNNVMIVPEVKRDESGMLGGSTNVPPGTDIKRVLEVKQTSVLDSVLVVLAFKVERVTVVP
jgi:hypothetical protein